MLSQLFILTSRGDAIVSRNYRPDVVRGTPEIFFRKLKTFPSDPPPIFSIEDIHFLHIKRNGLYFVCTTKFNVSPAATLELLQRVAGLIKDYCGVLSEESMRVNFVLVYELLDEIIDFGYGQNTATEALRAHIYKEPVSLAPVEKPTLRGMENKRSKPSTAPNKPISLRRRIREKDTKNEIYLDLLERLTVLFDKNGSVIRSEIDGSIQMKCFLKGSPEISVGLNEDLLIGKERGLYGLVLDDCNFHECVKFDNFENDKTLKLVPPDGEFAVMNYRVSGDNGAFANSLPFRVSVVIDDCTTPESHGANVIIKGTLPKATVGCGHDFGTPGHKFAFSKDDKTYSWTIAKMPGGASCYLRLRLSLNDDNTSFSREMGPISMDFEVPMYVCSGINLRFLRVMERGRTYTPFRWVRYITF
eukprot:gene9438-1680_t